MSDLSVVILCGRSPRHLYFANELCRSSKPLAIVQESERNWSFEKIITLLLNPKRLQQKLWRWLRDRRRYTGGQEAEFFFGKATPTLDRPDLNIETPHINHANTLAIIDKYSPDVIVVFGTSLIKGELLTKGRLGLINLHGGLSPEYRGADCTFWALYNQEPEKVGCTIHYINAGIDTGKLIAHVSPEVKENDSELSLFWRAVQDSVSIYPELLKRLHQGEKLGTQQTNKGALYQVKDRELKHELKLDELMQNGLLEKISLDRRVTWFLPNDHPTSDTVGGSSNSTQSQIVPPPLAIAE